MYKLKYWKIMNINIGKKQKNISRRNRRRNYILSSSIDTEFDEDDEDFELNHVLPTIISRSENQKQYNKALYSFEKELIISIGSPGTGKTMLAVIAGINMLNKERFDRIIITRPSVSVDEKIGYLPGGVNDKMSPFTTPIFDIFHKYYNSKDIQYMIQNKIIEIVPLSYMRGRTFDRSYIIADEMQNSTINQMQMILTRIGDESKIVITGDLNQTDRKDEVNGLKHFFDKITNKIFERIKIIEFKDDDIQRSELVKDILKIYDT